MSETVILVVDDHADTARWVAQVFRGDERHVTIAGTGSAARVLGGRFDVGVFEIEIAGTSGIELAQQMLAEGRLDQVVFFTRATWQGLLRRAAALGRVIPKDGGPAALATELRRMVQSRPTDDVEARVLASA
jgi:CheY-like chemotaxis protein